MSRHRNLILVGGIFHDFQASAEALATVLAPLGIESRIESDLDTGLASLATDPVDLITVNALRWEMIGEKYDPYRDSEAYSPPATTRAAFANHLETGGALLGGRWVWGTSFHPPPEKISVSPVDRDSSDALPAFEVHDELYTDLTLEPDAEVLAYGRSEAMPNAQPVLWRHTVGAGRVIYDALGHDSASLLHPPHAQWLRESVAWALREESAL
jgi:hypothetical protein